MNEEPIPLISQQHLTAKVLDKMEARSLAIHHDMLVYRKISIDKINREFASKNINGSITKWCKDLVMQTLKLIALSTRSTY